jgi:transcriptional regulator with XRE-family HTH domain
MVRFTTKKIDSLTLGERMKKIRSERRLSLAEISKSTKIQVKYLEDIEEGEYQKLPADVYVKGFLRSYAIFMGLNETMLIKQYEREKGIHKNIKKISDIDNTGRPIKFSSFIVTPKMIVAGGVAILVLASFLYLYREVNNFVSVPRLTIIKPADGAAIDGNMVHVIGIAEKDALVFINDQPVLVNENGEFGEDVGLKPGLNTINVKARSKFNKEAGKSVSVNANFQDAVQQSATDVADQSIAAVPQDAKPVFAEVYVSPNPTWLSVEADGNLVYSGVLLPQSVQTFDAKQSVKITSGKGNETFVKINGKDMGMLSGDPGVVRDIEYNAEGKINKN